MNQDKSSIMEIASHPVLALVLRIVIGLILLYAGLQKIVDMEDMAQSIYNYRLLPESTVNVLAIILPPIEILAGLCLILGILTEGALTVATGLFLVFLFAIASAVLLGLDIECGCFGTTDAERVGLSVLLRDLLFLAATVPVWLSRQPMLRLDSIVFRIEKEG